MSVVHDKLDTDRNFKNETTIEKNNALKHKTKGRTTLFLDKTKKNKFAIFLVNLDLFLRFPLYVFFSL